MTRRCTRFGIAVLVPALVGELEQVRFLGGNGALVQPEDRFCPAVLVLRFSRDAASSCARRQHRAFRFVFCRFCYVLSSAHLSRSKEYSLTYYQLYLAKSAPVLDIGLRTPVTWVLQ
jgi:hypothetical protein